MNGKIYLVLAAVLVASATSSSHRDGCICTQEYKPVCASDGKTYGNSCAMSCVGQHLTVTRQGQCDNTATLGEDLPACSQGCTRMLAPVCGTDGKTYSNKCLLRCSGRNAQLAHVGPCVDEVKVVDGILPRRACSRNFKPVCGDDGVTYNNLCLLQCAGRRMRVEGICEENLVKVVD